MLRAGAKLATWLTLIGGGAAAAAVATSEDPFLTMKVCTIVPARLLRDFITAATIVMDYEYSTMGLKQGSVEWLQAKHEAHERSALRLRELCFRNGGIYIKLGQHIGQLQYLVPREYVETMRTSMLKRCPVSSYNQVREVCMQELGGPPEQIFLEFDPVPLASASLAQVHAAKTHDGRKVAVKVQHTHLTNTAVADIATVDLIVSFLHWCFPAFDYRWLVDEIRESVPKELDFLCEAKNSIQCLDNFRRMSPHIAEYIYAPKVYWDLSTSKLLTMEFMDAPEILDVNAIRQLGVQPIDVSRLVSQAFAEMIFKHGFVHCDPHAANMMVRSLPSSKWNIFGRRRPQLILLDHGLYKELDFETRTNYAALWRALIFSDANGIKEYSTKLGAGEDLYALFAGILTMRPWNRVIDPAVDHLVLEGNDGEQSELQVYASQYFPQISELLRRLPRVILLMLKTNDCIRAVNYSLLQGSSLDTFLIIGRVSSKVVVETKRKLQKNLLSSPIIWFEDMLLQARLLCMQIALWILQLEKQWKAMFG
ncbi:Cadmium-transporting ATPase protein [Dioscorea alata]|uniref:Cadmium-transporting ATPase protein n=1 Tax=Dioscorea alata TaxID=55571 RepID=A0ACB7WMZ5_DIOAL|nr:Cadmium-transporting ATPase protein [Dioscorea alata]